MAIVKREDLVKMISEKMYNRYSQDEIYWIIKYFFDCIEDILRNGDTLRLYNTLVVYPVLKRERKCFNFGNGDIIIPAHWEAAIKLMTRYQNACSDLPLPEDDKKKNKKGKKKLDKDRIKSNADTKIK